MNDNLPNVHVIEMDGQGGVFFSLGMRSLAGRIQKLSSRIKVSSESWKYALTKVVPGIKAIPAGDPVILIGYSLGGNSALQVAKTIPYRTIDLMVAYDPSIYGFLGKAMRRLSGAALGGPRTSEVSPNVKRCLCYHNNGSSNYGHALFTGPQVEVTEINQGHLSVDFNEQLHLETIAAVLKVLNPGY